MSDGQQPSLEERKNELFATITLLAGVKRDLIGARGSRRLELIDRQARLEADKERLSHEVNSEYMYRNVLMLMKRVDDYNTERQQEAKETHTGLAGLSGQFRELAADVTQLKKDMKESQEDRQRIHDEVAELKHQLTAYIADEVEVLRREVERLTQERGG